MAEVRETQAIEDLTSKESSAISNNDTLLVINSSEGGYQATTQNLGDHMIQNARSNLNGKTQTVASAIDEVAGKLPSNNGTNNQILRSNGDGTSRWDNAASASEIGAAVTEWLEENISGGQTVAIDDSLTIENAAAESKAVGDALDANVKISTALSEEVDELKEDLNKITTIGTQLFDKDNAETEHWLISNDAIVVAGANTTSVIIPVEPSASDEYITVHRDTISSRFTVATFTEKPSIGSAPVTTTKNNTASSITIACSTSIHYLMVVLHNATADTTITVQTMLDGLMVEFGSSYTGYAPYSYSVIIPDKSVNGDSFSDDGIEFISDLVDDLTTSEQTLTDANRKEVLTKSEGTLSWTDGSYYNYLDTGDITASAGRAYTSKIDCKAGDRISITNNKGQILFWDRGGIYLGYEATSPNSTAAFVAPDGAVKYAFNNSDSTIRGVTATQYVSTNPVEDHHLVAPAKLIYDASDFIDGKYCSTTDGKISSVASYSCLPFVPVKSNHKYRTRNQTQIVFYDSTLSFISTLIPGGAAANTGTTVEMDFITPATCKYISINTRIGSGMLFDLDYTTVGLVGNPQKLQGKTILSFGDSITGNYSFGDNISYEVEKFCGAKTYNCGFGGCRMELLEESGSAEETAAITNPFAMCAIVDELAKDDSDASKWSTQDAAAATFEASPRYNRIIKFRLGILKTVDISNIDIVTIAYGTNEAGYPQDDENDKYNKYTYAGATRYSIEKLLEMNPKLCIVLLTPIYRHSFGSGEGDSDSFVRPSTRLGLLNNIETLKAVGLEYKVPVIDMYHDLGINKENYLSYFGDDDEPDDGTHINTYGRKRYGERLAGELNRLF